MTDQPTGVSRDLHDSHGIPLDQHSDDTPPTETTTTEKKRSNSMVREVIETLLLALLIFVAVRAVVLNFRVDGTSMDNSLVDNEMLLVNRNAYFSYDKDKWFGWMPWVDSEEGELSYPFGIPERGDIVVIDPPDSATHPDKPYIKRVIGLPGETIEIKEEGVYINGTRLEEPYIDGKPSRCSNTSQYCGPLVIPEGQVFVMGDNRTNSEDSRYFGPEPIGDIIGKAWVTYWPTSEIGVVPHYDYPELNDQASN